MLTAASGFTAGANGAAEQLDGLHLGNGDGPAAGADAAKQEQQHGVDSGIGAPAALSPAAGGPATADMQQEAAAPAASPAEMDALLQVP
jgi:hypothetical protein